MTVLLSLGVLTACAAPRSGEGTESATAAAAGEACPACGRSAGSGEAGATTDVAATDEILRASVGGKYRALLAMFPLLEDRSNYGDFHDWGYWAGSSWAGIKDLPSGHWVYVYPNWYIWGVKENAPVPR